MNFPYLDLINLFTLSILSVMGTDKDLNSRTLSDEELRKVSGGQTDGQKCREARNEKECDDLMGQGCFWSQTSKDSGFCFFKG